MAFSLNKLSYPYNSGVQRQALGAGGPSSGRTPAGWQPWPRHTPFFGVLQGFPRGTAKSNASPTPWNNFYAKPFTYTMANGPAQKMPTFTAVQF
jgi:hypothetical protein